MCSEPIPARAAFRLLALNPGTETEIRTQPEMTDVSRIRKRALDAEARTSTAMPARSAATKKSAPTRGDALSVLGCRSGGLLLRYLRPRLNARADLDRARLRRLRHFVNQVDMEHAIVDIGGRYLHVIGEAEPPLERAPRDAAVQVAAVPFLLILLRLARHQKRILLNGDVELVRREPGHRHREAIGILTGLLDIVRGVAEGRAVYAGRRIDQAQQTIKADRRTE